MGDELNGRQVWDRAFAWPDLVQKAGNGVEVGPVDARFQVDTSVVKRCAEPACAVLCHIQA